MFSGRFFRRTLLNMIAIGAAIGALASWSPAADAGEKKAFRLCWTTDVGRAPWGYAQLSGIMQKWADKYGISVEIVRENDYEKSISAYAAGVYDACAITNIDAFRLAISEGIDTTAIIVSGVSNGNVGIVTKDGGDLKSVIGKPVLLVEQSVSQYLLDRALKSAGANIQDAILIDTRDVAIAKAFKSGSTSAAVTWNPMLAEMLKIPGAKRVFDTTQIPGEIMEVVVARTSTLIENPELGKALAGAWYEVMALMVPTRDAGKDFDAGDLLPVGAFLTAIFDKELAATTMFYYPKDAAAFVESDDLKKAMDFVRKFWFDHGFMAEAASPDAVGIAFADGSILGNKQNVKLQFTSQYMKMSMHNQLSSE